MKEVASHTPTPWKVWGDNDSIKIFAGVETLSRTVVSGKELREIAGVETDDVPEEEALANAEFIVRACNSHAELLAALEAVSETLREFRQASNSWTARDGRALAQAEAAIQKAKP